LVVYKHLCTSVIDSWASSVETWPSRSGRS